MGTKKKSFSAVRCSASEKSGVRVLTIAKNDNKYIYPIRWGYVMSKAIFLRIFIGLFGMVLIVLTFWLSAYFHLNISIKLVIVLAFALATFFTEVIIAIDNLEKRLKNAFPPLELSLKDQIALNETIKLYNKLKKNNTGISTRIALADFEKIHHVLSQAEKNGDFVFHDIYSASMILLAALEPGQSFKVVSNLTKRFYWKSGKDMSEHTKLNYRQAKRRCPH